MWNQFFYLFYLFQIYLNNKTQIDPVLDKVKAQFDEIWGKVGAMIPQAKAVESKKEEQIQRSYEAIKMGSVG